MVEILLLRNINFRQYLSTLAYRITYTYIPYLKLCIHIIPYLKLCFRLSKNVVALMNLQRLVDY